MSEKNNNPAPVDPDHGTDPGGTPAPAASEPPAEPTPPAPSGGPEDVKDLPDWAQKKIAKLNEENAKDRTESKRMAAEEAEKALSAKLLKALGMGEEEDPTKAAEEKARKLEATEGKLSEALRELAVIRAAKKLGADAEALADSRSFMNKLAGLDLAADDFSEKLNAAIEEAVNDNPALKSGAAIPTKSGTKVGGGAAEVGQLTKEEIKNMSPEAIEKAMKEGRLKNYLGSPS